MKSKKRNKIWCSLFLVFAMAISGFGNNADVQSKTVVKKLYLNVTTMTMQTGDRVHLNVVRVKPASASKKVTWKSSDKKIVTVNKSGQVKAKKKGNATITARAKNGKAVAKCSIEVKERQTVKTNILIAYFSATGTTKGIAEKIAKTSGGDLYRITPAKKYTARDLDYTRDSCRAVSEQENKQIRPAMKGTCAGIQNYDTVFIGFPIWSYDAPRIISTFMESYDFSGKTVIPFCTSGGTGISRAVKTLKSVTKGKVKWRSGRQFDGDESQGEVTKWVSNFHLQDKGTDTTPTVPTQNQPANPPVVSHSPEVTNPPNATATPEESVVPEQDRMITIQIGTVSITAELAENPSAEALAQKLEESSLTVTLHDYGGFEKVGDLGFNLPAGHERITTEPGDIMLYLNNQITVFYGTNTWSYTRLARIQNMTAEELRTVLGDGAVTVTLSLKN